MRPTKIRKISASSWSALICQVIHAKIEKSLQNYLEKSEFDVTTTLSGKNALKKLRSTRFHLVITDLVTEGPDGIEILIKAKKINPEACVFILCGHETYETDKLPLKKHHFFKKQETLQNNRQ